MDKTEYRTEPTMTQTKHFNVDYETVITSYMVISELAEEFPSSEIIPWLSSI